MVGGAVGLPIYGSGFDDGLLIYDHHPPAVMR